MDEDYLDTEFQGLPVLLGPDAIAASRELNISLHDIIPILRGGEDCAGSRRRPNTLVRCARFGGKWIKIVARHDIHRRTMVECWLIVHLDETGRP